MQTIVDTNLSPDLEARRALSRDEVMRFLGVKRTKLFHIQKSRDPIPTVSLGRNKTGFPKDKLLWWYEKRAA